MTGHSTSPSSATISTLKPNVNANIEATIESISEPRDVSTQRGPARVADAILKDATGSVTLSLWNQDIEKFKAGQKIRIHDGWVREWRGKLQISMGRSGRIEII